MVVVVALLVSTCAVWAQGYGMSVDMDEMTELKFSNTNVPGAQPWPHDGAQWWGELRTWEGENWTYSAGARVAAGEESDVELTLFHMDTDSGDPIGTEVVESQATLLGLNYRWLAYESDALTISVIPGAEYPLDDMEGNREGSAISDELIPTVSVPFEFVNKNGTIFRVVPRYVGFDETPSVAADTTIDGFGDVFALAGGVVHPMDQFSLSGDLALILEGDNSIDENTNEPTDEFIWAAGGSWQKQEDDLRVDLFVTNAIGPTAATSLISTPDQSVGVGLRVSGEF